MFLEKANFTGRKNRIAVGYDIGDDTSQISFSRAGEASPETVSVVTGEEQYNFPTVLCRKAESNQWLFGREAVRQAEEGKAVLVERLLTLARAGTKIQVGEEAFDPVALLALFMKRSLSLLSMTASPEQIGTMMITVDVLDQRMIEVLAQAVSVMQLPAAHIYFQSHAESFYQYTIHQPRELWMGQVLVCDCDGDRIKTYRLECNRRTVPVVAFVEEREHPGLREDEALLQILQEECADRAISSAYLIGKGFEGDWYPVSLRYLCRGRRVFRGNNLYSKGACYGAEGKAVPDEAQKACIFLGKDKLKANLGMKALRRGEDSYYALLDAGINWFEAQKQCEFYLEESNSFSIRITSLTGKESRELEIILNGLPRRGERASRIGMSISMQSEKDVCMTLEDLGFGEIYPATHKTWQENFTI